MKILILYLNRLFLDDDQERVVLAINRMVQN